VIPEFGDVLIQGTSVVNHPRTARASLGVCPQFSAIDAQLTVREHLSIYGRLKGLRSEELKSSVESLMTATGLQIYADRLASKLSGGNQRKLSLAIALMGNPAVVLIDEFSTGIDAKKKREMWHTLRAVAVGKVFVITTHAMEEASALANKVGILAVRLLAIGSIEALSARYATYEVHFTCRTREDVTQAQTLMSTIPGARMADDVATRFEVPIGNGLTLAKLFHLLSAQGDFSEYTVEKATLESVFLKVIRENNVQEEGHESHGRRRWWPFRR
jgi:ABC-type multidrug transport system ATPase subunit